MKWLILLILISCGKHEEPASLDLKDSDGDQVLNYQESEFNKYVANFGSLGKVKGTLRFNNNGIVKLPFSNEIHLGEGTLKLIVMNENNLKDKDHFREWSKIRIHKEYNISELRYPHYKLLLQFERASDQPAEVVFIGETESLLLGRWERDMSIQLSAENMRSLLTGRGHFALKKKFRKAPFFKEDSEKTIREKTYRVHYFDGKEDKIYYVAKALPFKDFLRLLGIESSQFITEDEIFFNGQSVENRWYSREFDDGDKAIAYTNGQELRKFFTANYIYKKATVSRENGAPKTSLRISNPEGVKVYIRIRPISHSKRTFGESSDVRRHGYGGGGGREGSGGNWYNCTHYLRKVLKEDFTLPDLGTILKNMQILSQGKAVPLNLLISPDFTEDMDEKSVYWEMKLMKDLPDLEIQLNTRTASTFTVTGEYRNSCGSRANRGRGAAFSTNIEGKLSFEIESYVEKI